eukprot:Opistho-2@42807
MASAASHHKVKAETALQLFTHNETSKPVSPLGILPIDNAFPNGIPAQSTIELQGQSCSGKTQLLLAVVCQFVLSPPAGHGLSALLFDLDARFDVVSFSAMLMQRARVHLLQAHAPTNRGSEGPLGRTQGDSDVESEASAMTRSALARLSVVRCWTLEEAVVTLHSAVNMASANPSLRLLALDGAANFYWHERAAGGGGADELAAAVAHATQSANLVAIATVSSLMGRGRTGFMGRAWSALFRHRFLLDVAAVQPTPSRASRQQQPHPTNGQSGVMAADNTERPTRIVVNAAYQGGRAQPYTFLICNNGIVFE